MGKCMTVAIAGLGSRGLETYAKGAEQFPQKMKITAVADVDPSKVAIAAERYHIPQENCFSSAEEMLKRERLADVMVIATQDRQHVDHAVPALKKGYHILLEKPISPEISRCRELLETAREYNRRVVVCHVLRYTPIYQKAKQLLDAGEIGDVVSIMGIENVGWFHQAHSFVRGNWSNSDETSPMILQKCCHDMDLYLWLANKTCRSLTSYGSTYLFKKENAPKGSADFCMGGCTAREGCPFDAEEIYMKNRLIGFDHGNRRWPLDVVAGENPSREDLERALKTGRYGRCVYHCTNNVVDHQVVNLEMTDGTTMSFTMCGFTAELARYGKFMGTRGEMVVNLGREDPGEDDVIIRKFDSEVTETRVRAADLAEDFSGHGGGDLRMLEEFLDVLSGEAAETPYVTSLEKSLESHYCALAAEESRLNGGMPVSLDKYRK